MQSFITASKEHAIASQEYSMCAAYASKLADDYKYYSNMADKLVEDAVSASENGDMSSADTLYKKSVEAADLACVILGRLRDTIEKRDVLKMRVDATRGVVDELHPGLMDMADAVYMSLMKNG